MIALTEFLTRYRFTDDNPSVSRKGSRLHLCDLFKAMGFTKGAEIGVWEGAFSEQICKANDGVHLTCVDPWVAYASYRDPKNDRNRMPAAYEATKARLTPYNCTILRMTSLEAAERIPDGSLDFVYIDGNHGEEFVSEDLAAWAPKVRSGGIVAGHDYAMKAHLQVKPAVDRFVAANGIGTLYVLAGDKSPSWFWVQA